MRAQPMQVLPVAPGSHLPLRRYVRHPREIVTLVAAVVTSVLLLVVAVSEVSVAIDQRRTPDVYALALIFAPVLVWFARGQLWAQQRLSGIKLTPEQFPEAYSMLVDAAARSGLSYVPDAYVVLGNGVINAAASGHGFRRFVFVNSDLLEVGGAAREPDALRFVIAHEVGHIAAGHVSYWRILGTFASQWIPFIGSTLSRAQEYTADSYGHALAPQGARSAMATLAGGKYLGRSVDVDAMADRAVTEPGFFVWVTNAAASHPVLLWRMHALRDRRRPGRLLWRPKEPWLWGTPAAPGAYALPAMVGFVPTPLEVAAPSIAEAPAYAAVQQTYGAYAASPVDVAPTVGAPARREDEAVDRAGDRAGERAVDRPAPDPTRDDDRWRP
ncbi:M48 family metallopeptidase [Terrabacter tumescens]|nr:M48 family metalloprotease [Terrabacter tumescens]